MPRCYGGERETFLRVIAGSARTSSAFFLCLGEGTRALFVALQPAKATHGELVERQKSLLDRGTPVAGAFRS